MSGPTINRPLNAAQDIRTLTENSKNPVQEGERAGKAVVLNPQMVKDVWDSAKAALEDSKEEFSVHKQEHEADHTSAKERKVGKNKLPRIPITANVQYAEMLTHLDDPSKLEELIDHLRSMPNPSADDVLREVRNALQGEEDHQHQFLAFAQEQFTSEGRSGLVETLEKAIEKLESEDGSAIYKKKQMALLAYEAQNAWADIETQDPEEAKKLRSAFYKQLKNEYAELVDNATGPVDLLMKIINQNSPQDAGRKLFLVSQAVQTEVSGIGPFPDRTELESKLKALGDLRILFQSAEKLQELLDNTRKQADLQNVVLGG